MAENLDVFLPLYHKDLLAYVAKMNAEEARKAAIPAELNQIADIVVR